MRTSLVLQSFGKESEYKRVILTTLSYYAHTTLSLEETKVILFTDQPEYFTTFFEGLPIQYVPLTPERIRQMRGRIDFLHRMKIAVIEEAFQLADGYILYADSDTFFTDDPTPLLAQLSSDRSFMHLWEYQFEDLKHWKLPAGKTFRDFLQLIETKEFRLANGGDFKVSPQHVSWNAGVMMFHPTHERFIPDVYALTDQFYPVSQNHASEQYAFSIMLQLHTNISACDSVIYHYWYRVKKLIVDQFLHHELSLRWTKMPLIEKLVIVKSWTSMLPQYFEEHEWTIKDRAIQAFNEDRFHAGCRWAAKALIRKPIGSGAFIKDVLYHFKRQITKQ